jgi:uncharacterized protein (TIGR00369 family)
MDELDRLHAQQRDCLPGLLGIRYLEAGKERVRGELTAHRALCHPGGILHGGTLMAFADTLGAIGTVLNLPEGARTTTIESKTNFLAAAPEGSVVTGESTPLHRGGSTQVWQTRITLEGGRLVALITQTQLVLRPQDAPSS